MGLLLSGLFNFFRRKLFLFGFIVFILMSMNWIQNEWGDIQRIREELPSLQEAKRDVDEHQAHLGEAITSTARQLSYATVAQFDQRILSLDKEIQQLQKERENVSALPEIVKGTQGVSKQMAHAIKRSLTMEMLRQERDYLAGVRAYVETLGNRKEEEKKLKQLRQEHLSADAALHKKRRQQAAFEAHAGPLIHIPFTDANSQQKKFTYQVAVLQDANDLAQKKFLAQQERLNKLPSLRIPTEFKINEDRIATIISPLREQVLRAENLAAQSYAWQAYQVVRPWLAMALGILVGWWVVLAVTRTAFYFVLAPLAARRPPVVLSALEPTEQGSFSLGQAAQANDAVISAVAKKVRLAPDYELLLRPNYCQSQPEKVIANTKLLFDWSRSLTSIAANLWMLKRLRATHEVEIIVSSTNNSLDEVALLDIAPGSAFVLQPRGLVGMMYKIGQRPQIRSHWQVTSLHAWLTLQLRYLSFEGPVTLIVKGCRGVRLESALMGRTINQDATLGFSTNTIYATLRAEPFIPYLMGKQALLQDKFAGDNAYYLYEEVPRNGRPEEQRQNPIEVIFNAGMKAFGI